MSDPTKVTIERLEALGAKIDEMKDERKRLLRELETAQSNCSHDWEEFYVPHCDRNTLLIPLWRRVCKICRLEETTGYYTEKIIKAVRRPCWNDRTEGEPVEVENGPEKRMSSGVERGF